MIRLKTIKVYLPWFSHLFASSREKLKNEEKGRTACKIPSCGKRCSGKQHGGKRQMHLCKLRWKMIAEKTRYFQRNKRSLKLSSMLPVPRYPKKIRTDLTLPWSFFAFCIDLIIACLIWQASSVDTSKCLLKGKIKSTHFCRIHLRHSIGINRNKLCLKTFSYKLVTVCKSGIFNLFIAQETNG